MNAPRIIAIVPARGGSKGVPRKNVRPLAGKPLIAWTIAAAKHAATIGRIIVSTDDAEIAAVAKEHGADIPFMRPPELAQDTTPDLPVLQHVLQRLQADGDLPDVVVWLRPTVPLRTTADIDGAVAMLKITSADSVRSVSTAKAHPYWMKTVTDGLLHSFVSGKDDRTHPNRQSLPPVYMLNGAVDVMRARIVLEQNDLWGSRVGAYVMPPERSIDIDTLADFAAAEALLKV
jgi:CMP-N-acetylneuraminic acid synthetase